MMIVWRMSDSANFARQADSASNAFAVDCGRNFAAWHLCHEVFTSASVHFGV